MVSPRVGFRNTALSSLICPPLAPTSFLVVFTRLCLVIPIRVVTDLPIVQTDALGMAATFLVCLSFALLGALRPILLHWAASNVGLVSEGLLSPALAMSSRGRRRPGQLAIRICDVLGLVQLELRLSLAACGAPPWSSWRSS